MAKTISREAGDTGPSDLAAVAIAASAGGLQAISAVLSDLPADLPATILIVQHIAAGHTSHLPEILQRVTDLRVREGREGDALAEGEVYVAPPDRHMLVADDMTVTLSRAPLVNFVRPSATLLLESVGAAFGERAIGVVLSGSGSDGAQGIKALRQREGVTIAQDQATAEVFGMPAAAIATGAVDFVLPIGQIAPAIRGILAKDEAWLRTSRNETPSSKR